MRLLSPILFLARIAAYVLSMLLLATPAAAAPTLLVDQGVLTGADGVLVDGVSYDVRFVEGSCSSLFAGCTNFAFTSQAAAMSASQALLDQVLINGGAGSFDSSPEMTFGCADLTFCYVLTPFIITGPQVAVFGAVNNSQGSDVAAFIGPIGVDASTANITFETYAVWTQSTVMSVPEGDTLSLAMAAALAALLTRRRRRPSPTRFR